MSEDTTTNWRGNFLNRITPGNWIVLGTLLVTAVFSYATLSGQNSAQNDALSDLKAQIRTLASNRDVEQLQKETKDSIDEMKGQIDVFRAQINTMTEGFNARLSAVGERSNTTSSDLSGVKATVEGLKDAISEMRRQSSLSRRSFDTGSSPSPIR